MLHLSLSAADRCYSTMLHNATEDAEVFDRGDATVHSYATDDATENGTN